jgi:hypothetical protein
MCCGTLLVQLSGDVTGDVRSDEELLEEESPSEQVDDDILMEASSVPGFSGRSLSSSFTSSVRTRVTPSLEKSFMVQVRQNDDLTVQVF